LIADLADQALQRDLAVVPLMVPELIPVPAELRRDDGGSVRPHRPALRDRASASAKVPARPGAAAGGPQLGGTGLQADEFAAADHWGGWPAVD
jgi:hypothetical protein